MRAQETENTIICKRHLTGRENSMQRAIITVVGKDTIGIIAGVCT